MRLEKLVFSMAQVVFSIREWYKQGPPKTMGDLVNMNRRTNGFLTGTPLHCVAQ